MKVANIQATALFEMVSTGDAQWAGRVTPEEVTLSEQNLETRELTFLVGRMHLPSLGVTLPSFCRKTDVTPTVLQHRHPCRATAGRAVSGCLENRQTWGDTRGLGRMTAHLAVI